ncbi:hypothetical protein CCM_02439 [Cordyceps militaris CM01]|uniref:Uncharacterized protein n=1 Tax=Cordyceps militaris (strain CM01) TaxID=983644 RepID=G3J9P2_CORMM|nr:uncharacterized protein CCM_02439 [Cordyceps militaris CM01]EGX94168.1 hypothetical protein CCM_02439 [Cordyceps militaris CM01]
MHLSVTADTTETTLFYTSTRRLIIRTVYGLPPPTQTWQRPASSSSPDRPLALRPTQRLTCVRLRLSLTHSHCVDRANPRTSPSLESFAFRAPACAPRPSALLAVDHQARLP